MTSRHTHNSRLMVVLLRNHMTSLSVQVVVRVRMGVLQAQVHMGVAARQGRVRVRLRARRLRVRTMELQVKVHRLAEAGISLHLPWGHPRLDRPLARIHQCLDNRCPTPIRSLTIHHRHMKLVSTIHLLELG